MYIRRRLGSPVRASSAHRCRRKQIKTRREGAAATSGQNVQCHGTHKHQKPHVVGDALLVKFGQQPIEPPGDEAVEHQRLRRDQPEGRPLEQVYVNPAGVSEADKHHRNQPKKAVIGHGDHEVRHSSLKVGKDRITQHHRADGAHDDIHPAALLEEAKTLVLGVLQRRGLRSNRSRKAHKKF